MYPSEAQTGAKLQGLLPVGAAGGTGAAGGAGAGDWGLLPLFGADPSLSTSRSPPAPLFLGLFAGLGGGPPV